MSLRRTNDIKILSERLGSLQITEEASSEYKKISTDEISTAPVPATAVAISKNAQAVMLKNIVLDPE